MTKSDKTLDNLMNNIKSGYISKTPAFMTLIGMLEMLSLGLIILNHVLSGVIVAFVVYLLIVITA